MSLWYVLQRLYAPQVRDKDDGHCNNIRRPFNDMRCTYSSSLNTIKQLTHLLAMSAYLIEAKVLNNSLSIKETARGTITNNNLGAIFQCIVK